MKYGDLLIWQYKDKPKARATIDLFDDQYKKTLQGLLSLPDALDIDTAGGKNLDLIGKHVGQSRSLNEFTPLRLFSLHKADYPGKQHQWGLGRDGQGGGRWYRRGSPLAASVELDDIDYRFLIRCRIAKNYMTGTLNNITELLSFIFNPKSIAYDQYDMRISVTIRSDNITDFQRYAITQLDILPRPAGVSICFYVAVTSRPFGFFRLNAMTDSRNALALFEKQSDVCGFGRLQTAGNQVARSGKFARIL